MIDANQSLTLRNAYQELAQNLPESPMFEIYAVRLLKAGVKRTKPFWWQWLNPTE
jgi:hypothetical protein